MTTSVAAAVLRHPGEPLVVEQIELEDVGPRDVRVRLAASGVCHSDLSVQNGSIPFLFPTVLGHEGAGVVEEVGDAVTRVAPGDHVVLTWMPPCRSCFWCLAGQPMLCERGLAESLSGPYATVGGVAWCAGLGTATFAEQTLVPEGEVVRIDPSVPLELAALVGCALSTGVGAVWRTAGVTPGSSVAVVGCGGVGLSVVQGARLAGASTIVAVDRVGAKLDGAGHGGHRRGRLVGRGRGGRRARPDRWTRGRLRLRGGREGDAIQSTFAMTRRGGTTVLVGAGSPSEQVAFSAMELFVDAKTLVGCVYGRPIPTATSRFWSNWCARDRSTRPAW